MAQGGPAPEELEEPAPEELEPVALETTQIAPVTLERVIPQPAEPLGIFGTGALLLKGDTIGIALGGTGKSGAIAVVGSVRGLVIEALDFFSIFGLGSTAALASACSTAGSSLKHQCIDIYVYANFNFGSFFDFVKCKFVLPNLYTHKFFVSNPDV